ncbi:MAG: shikimate kinase [Bacteroidales bacterium]|nr:shikimate kinase [Bacteroidales bacterium]
MKVFLVGYMASGKSNLGRKLAHIMKLKFIDLDQFIEKKTNKTIPYIFRTEGEEIFREIELESLKEITTSHDDFILATGGGTPLLYQNMDYMNKQGKTVYLKVENNVLVERLKNAKKNRPVLTEIPNSELADFVKKEIKEREEYYNQAKVIIDTFAVSVDQLAMILNY